MRNMAKQNHIFTYGDKIRRRNSSQVLTIQSIDGTAYHFSDGGFMLIEDQDCFELVEKASGYFLVASDLKKAPFQKHLQWGYEDEYEFTRALRKLLSLWRGRIGRNIEERNGFLHLRFTDIPGGGHEDAWLPLFLLSPTEDPHTDDSEESPEEKELNKAFGFD